jgi:signal transduction histidine kinase
VSSIRSRLAVGYAVTLLLTLGGFCAAVYLELRKPSISGLDEELARERDLAIQYLTESHRVLGPLVEPGVSPVLDRGVAAGFQGLRDYLLLVDTAGNILYTSDSLAALPFADLQLLTKQLTPPPAEGHAVSLRLQSGREVRVLATPLGTAGEPISAILVAAPVDRSAPDASVFLRSMLLVAPLVLLASVLAGYWLSTRALQPVRGITDELEAITDGRSLHRRLEVPLSGDEVSRLAQTLNGMLARLEQSFASLHRFTADASHELKTPLMVLRAGVERSLTNPRTPTEVMVSLDETLGEINRMTELVESLLTLARADDGRAPLPVERTDLRELVAEASETAGMLAESGLLKVVTSMPEEPVWVMVDRRRIREMLLNLVTNAIKYTPASGRVELALSVRSDGAAIVVRDTGIGIASNDLPHIFERFWRADLARTRTGERPGSGLGLAITKWIAEAHGGSIAASSRLGRGTTVTVVLPLPDTDGADSPEVS